MDVTVTIQKYKRTLITQGYAAKTIELYSWGLDVFGEYLRAHAIEDLRAVTRKTMLDYQAGVMATGHSSQTKAVKIRAVKRLFEHLSETNRLLLSPTEGVTEIVKAREKIGTVLTQKEVQTVLSQADLNSRPGLRDRAVMEVLYATAIRSGELLSLELEDVDFPEGELSVRHGKGAKDRVVPLGSRAARYVKAYLETVRPHYSRKDPKERRLFLNQKGRPMTWNNLHANLYRYGQRAQLGKPVTAHTFRRSADTHLVQQGADIRYVQTLLGHESLKSTRQYVKIMPIEVKTIHKETHPNETAHRPA